MTEIQLALRDGTEQIYRRAISRSLLAQESSQSSLLFTDRADLARVHLETDGWVLFLDPFGVEPEEAKLLADSGRVMPVQVGRLVESVNQIKDAVRDGRLGNPGLVRIHHWSPKGIPVNSTLRHWLDLAVWLIGKTPDTVYGVRRRSFAQTHLGWDDGPMALIDVDSVPGKRTGYFSLSMIGSTGAAYDDLHRNIGLLMNSDGIQAQRTISFVPQLDIVLQKFIDAVAAESRLTGCWQSALRIIELEERVVESMEAKQAVTTGGSND